MSGVSPGTARVAWGTSGPLWEKLGLREQGGGDLDGAREQGVREFCGKFWYLFLGAGQNIISSLPLLI